MLEEKLQTLIDTIEKTNIGMDALIDAVRNMFLNPELTPETESERVEPVQETDPEPETASNPVISDDQASVIRKEALRIKKLGKLKDFSKLINQYGYEKVSLIGVKDFDEILEIAKTIK